MAKNVILISVDSLRHDALSPTMTPNLWRLAEQGGYFDTTLVQAPFTIPSHGSMLTGLYPFNHGLRKQFGEKIRPTAQTAFHRLQQRDYKTLALMGMSVFGKPQGYFEGFHKRKRRFSRLKAIDATFNEFGSDRFFLFLHYWAVHIPYRTLFRPQSPLDIAYNASVIAEERLGKGPERFLPRRGDAWLNRVHRVRDMVRAGDPRQVAQVKAGYDRSLKVMDRWLGAIFELLDQHKLADSTSVIITSDHGESFNEQGEADLRPDGYEHGHFLYETAVRVPTVMVGPDIPRQRVSGMVEQVDLVPTVYDLLGEPVTADDDFMPMDGRSLTGVLQGEPTLPTSYSETLRRADYRQMWRGKRYKLIWDRVTDTKQLFDVQVDSAENNDIAAQHPAIVADYCQQLDQFLAARTREYSDKSNMTAAELAATTAHLRALGYVD